MDYINLFHKNWAKIVIGVIIMLALVCFYRLYRFDSGIEIGFDSKSAEGKQFSEVEEVLTSTGFTNVYGDELEDLTTDEIDKDGQITNIILKYSLFHRRHFNANQKYPYDSQIIIEYHSLTPVAVPVSSKQAAKKDYKELEKELKEAGFISISTSPLKDLTTGWIHKENSVSSITIDGDDSFSKGSKYRPDVKIEIKYHSKKRRKSN